MLAYPPWEAVQELGKRFGNRHPLHVKRAMAEERDQGFKVSDRRMFNPDGTLRRQEEQVEEPDPLSDVPRPAVEAADNIVSFPGAARKDRATTGDSHEPGRPASLPVPSFGDFINMLAVEAAMHLGLVENPMEGSPAVDLEAARHMIDTLGMLKEKTRGNLTSGESAMLESILSELRMQFVALSRGR